MKTRIGMHVHVTQGAGLSTGKTGTVVNPRLYLDEIRQETGRYRPFDITREVAILSPDGKVFTMFPQYLEALQ